MAQQYKDDDEDCKDDASSIFEAIKDCMGGDDAGVDKRE
jgi:hypothetical protein